MVGRVGPGQRPHGRCHGAVPGPAMTSRPQGDQWDKRGRLPLPPHHLPNHPQSAMTWRAGRTADNFPACFGQTDGDT